MNEIGALNLQMKRRHSTYKEAIRYMINLNQDLGVN